VRLDSLSNISAIESWNEAFRIHAESGISSEEFNGGLQKLKIFTDLEKVREVSENNSDGNKDDGNKDKNTDGNKDGNKDPKETGGENKNHTNKRRSSKVRLSEVMNRDHESKSFVEGNATPSRLERMLRAQEQVRQSSIYFNLYNPEC
jgi:hypothetical protein